MSNILNHNRLPFEFKLSKDEYWDFHLHIGRDAYVAMGLQTECLSAFIDTSLPNCIVDEKHIVSMNEYSYNECKSKGITLDNIGYTGVDNGLYTYNKETISDEEFTELYTNSKLTIEQGDCKFHLHSVSGNSGTMCYNTSFEVVDGFVCSKLNGGFYQGFFRTGDGCNYSVLPSNIGNGLSLEFELKKCDFENECEEGKTSLNDKNPKNKGIFFYIGTRSENKWIKYYGDECCGTEKVESPNYETTTGIKIGEKTGTFVESDNKYLIYDRTCGGVTTLNNEGNEIAYVETTGKELKDNPFTIFSRKCPDGKTALSNLENLYINQKYNIYKDLWNNGLAFQILDDGSVGYKYIVKNCESENPECNYKIESEFSYPQNIPYDEWVNVHVRILPSTVGKMRLLFYVNGRLVLFSKELPSLELRELEDLTEKQEGVPFNISLGGGTQGLCESVYGKDEYGTPCLHPLEEEFGGSFIGYFKSFKFYSCSLNYNQINENVSTLCGTAKERKIYCGALIFNTKPMKTPIYSQSQLIPILNEYSYNVREIGIKVLPNIEKKYVRLILASPCSLNLTLISVLNNTTELRGLFEKTNFKIPTPAGEYCYDVWYSTFETDKVPKTLINFKLE